MPDDQAHNAPAAPAVDQMSPAEFKVFENKVRRMAARQNLRLVKARRRDPRAYDYGTYSLIDSRNCVEILDESLPVVYAALSGADDAAPSRTDQAIAIRDAAVEIVKARGVWQDVGPFKTLTATVDGLEISYRTPFNKVPPPSVDFYRKAALAGLTPKDNLPHGLDIRTDRKVLNIEWSDDGTVEIVGFKRGVWEDVVLGNAKGKP